MKKNSSKKIKFDSIDFAKIIDKLRIPLTFILLVVITYLSTRMSYEQKIASRNNCTEQNAQKIETDLRQKLEQSEKEKSELQAIVDKIKNEAQNTTLNVPASNEGKTQVGTVNINTATVAELDKLPGIGPVYAQRIIEYRKSHGGFKSLTEIKNIKGIGEKTYLKFKDLISL